MHRICWSRFLPHRLQCKRWSVIVIPVICIFRLYAYVFWVPFPMSALKIFPVISIGNFWISILRIGKWERDIFERLTPYIQRRMLSSFFSSYNTKVPARDISDNGPQEGWKKDMNGRLFLIHFSSSFCRFLLHKVHVQHLYFITQLILHKICNAHVQYSVYISFYFEISNPAFGLVLRCWLQSTKVQEKTFETPIQLTYH